MLYSQSDDRRNFVRGNRSQFKQGRIGWQTQGRNPDQWQADRNRPREFGRRGSHHAGPSKRSHSSECGYCRKYGHYEEECRKKACNSASTGQQLTNYASNSDYDDCSGISMNHATDESDYGDRCRMFVMRQKAQSMLAQASTSTSASNNVWFVDSGASNHMTLLQRFTRACYSSDHWGLGLGRTSVKIEDELRVEETMLHLRRRRLYT